MTIIAPRRSEVLSIAIPVYNFGSFLPHTLDSILDQALARGIEVLVFDGGSSDDTRGISKGYAARYPNFRYVRALKRRGIDVDMARCVELVSAAYCWLFSGDDVMRSNAIECVLAAIGRWEPDLILCRHSECHLDMSVLKDWPILAFSQDTIFELSRENCRRKYLESALTSEAFFSFMGGLVVKRQRWLSGRLLPALLGSNWAHVGRLWSLMGDPFKLAYLHNVLLDRRGGNDSFSSNGMLSRLDIQINGLLNVIEGIFGDHSIEFYHLRRVIRSEVEPNWAAAVRADLKCRNAPPTDFDRLDRMLDRLRI